MYSYTILQGNVPLVHGPPFLQTSLSLTTESGIHKTLQTGRRG
jgi:hypothetical protein